MPSSTADAAGGDALATLRDGIASGRRVFARLCLPRGADLRGRDLSRCDLSGATLRGALLDGAALDRCRLVEAKLTRASLRDTLLVRADLRGADLRGADLRGADLTCADLAEADLTLADLRGAVLERTAVSLGCKTFAGVALGGLAARQLYSLLLLARVDDANVKDALETLRARLEVPLAFALPEDSRG